MNHEKHVPAGPVRRGPHGPGGRMMPGEKARDFKGTILRLLAYIGKYKAAVGVVMLFAMAGTLFSVLGPKILGNATTELFNGLVAKVQGTGGIDFDKIGRILLLYPGLDHDRNYPEDLLPDAAGYLGKDPPDAHEIL